MTNGGTPVTLAGSMTLLFAGDGRCRELREYWHFAPEHKTPPGGLGRVVLIVAGASGHLGRGVAEELLEPERRRAACGCCHRTPDALADLAARGADVRFADFDDPASLPAAPGGRAAPAAHQHGRAGPARGPAPGGDRRGGAGRGRARDLHVGRLPGAGEPRGSSSRRIARPRRTCAPRAARGRCCATSSYAEYQELGVARGGGERSLTHNRGEGRAAYVRAWIARPRRPRCSRVTGTEAGPTTSPGPRASPPTDLARIYADLGGPAGGAGGRRRRAARRQAWSGSPRRPSGLRRGASSPPSAARSARAIRARSATGVETLTGRRPRERPRGCSRAA